MDKVIKRTQGAAFTPVNTKGRLITSFCYAILAFTGVVLLHQGLIALLSVKLGYTTHFSFAKVDSMPYENKYWGTYRVLILYAMPPLLLIIITALLVSRMFMHTKRKIDKWYSLSYWWVVSTILYISAQATIPLIAYSFGKDDMYQGLPVLFNWFYVPNAFRFGIAILAIVLNVLFGFLFFQFTIQFSPSRGSVFNHKKQTETVKLYFAYPMLACIPVAIFLSLPKLPSFFLVYMILGLLWVPGLVIRGRTGQANETRLDPNQIRDISTRGIALIVLFILVVRVFFSVSDYFWYK